MHCYDKIPFAVLTHRQRTSKNFHEIRARLASNVSGLMKQLAFDSQIADSFLGKNCSTIMKKIICLLSLFIFVSSLPVEAQNRRNQNNKQQQAAAAARAKKAKEEKAEKEKRDKINRAIDSFLEDHDQNHDKSVSLEEFVGGEKDAAAAEKKFQAHNKNKDRYLSKTEIQEMLGL
jgi:hypothetical protein